MFLMCSFIPTISHELKLELETLRFRLNNLTRILNRWYLYFSCNPLVGVQCHTTTLSFIDSLDAADCTFQRWLHQWILFYMLTLQCDIALSRQEVGSIFLPLNLGRQACVCGRSDTTWVPRLTHNRQYSFWLIYLGCQSPRKGPDNRFWLESWFIFQTTAPSGTRYMSMYNL